MKFNIGDTVKWTNSNDRVYIGTVIGVLGSHTTVDFTQTPAFKRAYTIQSYTFNDSFNIKLCEPAKVLSIEERVANKSKRLWNESKFVKKYSHLAY